MIEQSLDQILNKYMSSFVNKCYLEENDDLDLLMNVFGLSPKLKRENRQYWGRELGMCWQLLVSEICRTYCQSFKPALRFGADEPCDLVVGNYAIDTKYRIGSGDSGTLKKFKQYGAILKEEGYTPVFLILRNDNLSAAMTACYAGGWQVCTGDTSYNFIHDISGFDLKSFLTQRATSFPVIR